MHNYINGLIAVHKDFKDKLYHDIAYVIKIIANALSLRKYQLFNGKTCSILLITMSNYNLKWHENIPPRIKSQLLNMLLIKTPTFNAQDVADVWHGLSSILSDSNFDYEITNRIAKLLFKSISRNADKFNEQNITNLLTALSKLVLWTEIPLAARKTLFHALEQNLEKFKPRDIANIFNAFGKFEIWEEIPESLRNAMIDLASNKAEHDFNGRDIATTLNSLSKFIKWDDLESTTQDKFISSIENNIEYLSNQDVSLILNALANLLYKQSLSTRINDIILNLIEKINNTHIQFNAHDIAITLNGLSKLFKWSELSDTAKTGIIRAIKYNASKINHQHIANISRALSNIAEWSDLAAIDSYIIILIRINTSKFNGQELANIFNALSNFYKHSHIPGFILRPLIERLLEIINDCNEQNITNILHALSKQILWNELPEKVIQCILQQISESLLTGKLNIKDIASTLHAFFLFKAFDNPMVAQITYELISSSAELNYHEFKGKACLQLAISIQYLKAYHKDIFDKLQKLPTDYLDTVYEKAHSKLKKNATPSKIQEEVYAIIRQLGYNAGHEGVINSCISVDIVLPSNIAIEVNGPHHFKDQEFNASTKRKQELLSALGFKVININHNEIDNLSQQEKRQLILQKLENKPRKLQTYAFDRQLKRATSASVGNNVQRADKKARMIQST